MLFEDTPNPNAKKISMNHNYEVGTYLDENLKHNQNIDKLLSNKNIVNIFTGPNFLTVLKTNESTWESIIGDLETNS